MKLLRFILVAVCIPTLVWGSACYVWFLVGKASGVNSSKVYLNARGDALEYATCKRCGDSYWWKPFHKTAGRFPLCQECWASLTPAERLPYHQGYIDADRKWNAECGRHGKTQYAPPYDTEEAYAKWIRDSVLNEGPDDGETSIPPLGVEHAGLTAGLPRSKPWNGPVINVVFRSCERVEASP